MDLRGLERLVEAHLGEDGRQPAREHRLARPRWTTVTLLGTCRRVSVPIRPRLSRVIPSTRQDSRSRATGAGTCRITVGKSAASFNRRAFSAFLSAGEGRTFNAS